MTITSGSTTTLPDLSPTELAQLLSEFLTSTTVAWTSYDGERSHLR